MYYNATPEELAEYIGTNGPIDFNCIILFLRRRQLSPAEENDLKKLRQERAEYWSMSRLKENFKDLLAKVDPRYKQDVIDLLYTRRGCLAGKPEHLRIGITTFCLDAMYPENLQMHVKSHVPSGLKRAIAARLQRIMITSGIAKRMDEQPACVHNFLVVMKPGAKMKKPTDIETLNAMTDKECEATWRCVIDSSSLGGLVYNTPAPDPPTIYESLAKIEGSSFSSIVDLKRAYDQTRSTDRVQRLFCFKTSIVGMPLATVQSLPQGFKDSGRHNQFVASYSVERQNNIPAALPFPEFKKAYRLMNEEEEAREKERFERRRKEAKESPKFRVTICEDPKSRAVTSPKIEMPERPKSRDRRSGDGRRIFEEAMRIPVSTDERVIEKTIAEELSKSMSSEKTTVERQDIMQFGSTVYADDVLVNSSKNIDKIKKLGVNPSTFMRKPKSESEWPVLFHLSYINRVLYCLEEANFLVSASKVNILCQDEEHSYLGFTFKSDVISIPKRTIETIRSLPIPTTKKEIQRVVGLICYYQQILKHSRPYTGFLTSKLRKGADITFTEEDVKKFETFKEILCKVKMKGFITALDPYVKDRHYLLYTDWCSSVHSSSNLLCVVMHNEKGTTVLPAVADSRSLSPSLKSGGSTLCECGSLISALHHLKPLIFMTPILAYTDNLALVFLMNRRFATNCAIDSPVCQRLLLSIENVFVHVRFCPSELQLSDALSRIKIETGKTVDQLLTHSNKLSDFDYVEQIIRPDKRKENEQQFIERADRNIKMIRKLEAEKGDSRDDLYSLFKRTHLNARDLKTINMITDDQTGLESPTNFSPQIKLTQSIEDEVEDDRDDVDVDDDDDDDEARTDDEDRGEPSRVDRRDDPVETRPQQKRVLAIEGNEGEERSPNGSSIQGNLFEQNKEKTETCGLENEKSKRGEFDFSKIISPRERKDKVGEKKTCPTDQSSKPVNKMSRQELIDRYNEKIIIPDYKSTDFETLPVLQLDGEQNRIPTDCYTPKEYQYKTDMLDAMLSANANDRSALSQRGQKIYRQDSLMITKTPDLLATIISDTPDGILSDGFGHEMGPTIDYLAEINFILHTAGPQEESPLFESYEDAHKYLKKGHLADEIQSNHKYFLSCQTRDLDFIVLRKLLKGELTMQDHDIDVIRKTSRMARILLDDFQSVFLFSNLIFRLIFPKKGDKARAVLCLPSQDLARLATRHHLTCHRGSIFTYTVLACKYWCPSMYNVILDVCKACTICSEFHLNRKIIGSKFKSFLDLNSICQLSADLKGPLEYTGSKGPQDKKKDPWDDRATKKYWILCVVNPVVGYNQYFYLKDKKASTVVSCLYNNYLRYFSGVSVCQFDEGAEYVNKLNISLHSLFKISLKFVCKSNPKANKSEKSVAKLSHVLKSVLQGRDFNVKARLTDLSIITNNIYLGEIHGMAANYAYGASNGDSMPYSPAILCNKKDMQHQGEWTEVTDRMRHIIKLLREHYNCYITLQRSNIHTFESLNIQKGDLVYFRTYARAHPLSLGLSTLVPKWGVGEIVKVLSRSAALIKNSKTDKVIRRHINDIHPMHSNNPWILNTDYMKSLTAQQTEKAGLDLNQEAERAEQRDTVAVKNKYAMDVKEGEKLAKINPGGLRNKVNDDDNNEHLSTKAHKGSIEREKSKRNIRKSQRDDTRYDDEDFQDGGRKLERKSKRPSGSREKSEMIDTRSKKSSKDSTRAQSKHFDDDDDNDGESDDDASFPPKDRRRRSKRLREKRRVDYREN